MQTDKPLIVWRTFLTHAKGPGTYGSLIYEVQLATRPDKDDAYWKTKPVPCYPKPWHSKEILEIKFQSSNAT